MLSGAAAAAPGSLTLHRARWVGCGTPPTADSQWSATTASSSRIYRRCSFETSGCTQKFPRRHPAARLSDHLPRGAAARRRCARRSSSVRSPPLSAGNGDVAAGTVGRPERTVPRAGATRRPSEQSRRGIGRGASAVPWFTSKGMACISAGRGGRSRRQQSVSASRCRFKRGSRREKKVSAERKHQTRRSQLLSPGSSAHPRLRLSGIPSGLPRPGRGARHGRAPRLQPRRGGAGGHRRCSPDGSGGSGQEERAGSGAAGAGRREGGAGWGCCCCRRRSCWGRSARRGPRLRGAELSADHDCGQYTFFFSLPFLSFPSLLLLLSCSQTSSINAGSFVCVCLCRGEGDVAFNYYFSNNQRITRDPPSSYDALLEWGCPPPQPLAQKGAPRGYCPGSPSGFAAGPAGAAGSGGRALTRRSPLAGRWPACDLQHGPWHLREPGRQPRQVHCLSK